MTQQHPTPPIHAWAVVPANGQPVLCIERTRAEQIAPAMHGVIVELTAPVAMTDAARDVLDERTRQVAVEDYDHAHDDEHVSEEIAALAAYYAMPPGAREWSAESTGCGDTLGVAMIPNGWAMPSPCDRRSELVKAGALILAEIERIDRAARGARS